MSKLELKEGVTYRRRNGELTKLTWDNDRMVYFCNKLEEFSEVYALPGHVYLRREDELDLIEIVEEDEDLDKQLTDILLGKEEDTDYMGTEGLHDGLEEPCIVTETIDKRLEITKEILSTKAKEYMTSGDRLGNFKDGAVITGLTPRQYLWAVMAKHTVCVKDLVDRKLDDQYASEKIGDMINYLMLLEGMIAEENK